MARNSFPKARTAAPESRLPGQPPPPVHLAADPTLLALLKDVTFSGNPVTDMRDVIAYPQTPDVMTTLDGNPIEAVRFIDATGHPVALGAGIPLGLSELLVLPNNDALENWAIPVPGGSSAAVITQGRTTPGDGGGGIWVFMPGDHQADVARDPAQGCFIAPANIPTGSTGVWARQDAENGVNAEWFGAKGDGIANDQPALQAASDYCRGGTLRLAQRSYRITSTWTIDGNSNPMKVIGQGQGYADGLGSRVIVDTVNKDGIVCSNFDHGLLQGFCIEGPPGPARLSAGYLLRLRDFGSFIVLRDLLIERGYRLIGVSSGLAFLCQNVRTRQSGGDIAWHSIGNDPTESSYPAGFQCIDCSFGATDINQVYTPDGVSTNYTISLFVARLSQVRLTLISRMNYAKQRLVQGTQAQVTSGQRAITTLSWAAGVGTAAFAGAHGITAGSYFTIAGAVPAAFNGRWVALPTSTSTVLNFTMADMAIVKHTWLATDGQNPTLSGVVTVSVRNRVPVGASFTISGATPAAYNGTFTALPGTGYASLKYQMTTNPGPSTVQGVLVLTPSPTTATTPGQLVVFDYWVEQYPATAIPPDTVGGKDAVRVHFAAPPATNTWIFAQREQPQFFTTTGTSTDGLREPVLFLFEGRSGSNKFVNSSGGFCGDGFVVRADDPSSNAGAYMFANWGLENVAGDVLRIEAGTDFRLSNCYLSGDANGLNVIFDPLSIPNIANATQQPSSMYNGPVRITTTVPHGLAFPVPDPIHPGMFIYPAVLVSGVLSNPKIALVNGRWFVSVVDALNFDLIAAALYLVHGQPPVSGAPSMWKKNFDDPEPVYTAGSGSWNDQIPGLGNVRVTNSDIRGSGLSCVRVDMPGCIITNSQLTTAGRYNKDYWGDNVTEISNNGSGLVRVVTKYLSEIQDDSVVRLTHVTKAGATDTVLRDGRYRCTMVDHQTFDLKGSVYTGPYDAPTMSAPVFLLPVGSSLEIGTHGSNTHASGNWMGDWTEGGTDPQEYAVINKCANLLTIHDNYVGNVDTKAINNFAPHARQRWSNNYDYADYGARILAKYDDGSSVGTSIANLFGSGSPEGVVSASLGSTYVDTSNGIMWSKRSNLAPNTGWQQGTALAQEEGSWTPQFTFLTPGDLAVAYTTQLGFYQRTGATVWLRFSVTFTPTFSTGGPGPTGEARIIGLPFVPSSSTEGGFLLDNNSGFTYPASTIDMRVTTTAGQSYLRLAGMRSGSVALATAPANFISGTSTGLTGLVRYRV